MYYLKVLGMFFFNLVLAMIPTVGFVAVIFVQKWTGCKLLFLLFMILVFVYLCWKNFLDFLKDPHHDLGCKFPKEKTMLNRCQWSMTCEICHQTEIYGEHVMVNYVKPGEHPCQKYLKCNVCGMEEKKYMNHNEMSRVDPKGSSVCDLILKCSTCGEERRATVHSFALRTCGFPNKCDNCGFEDDDILDHDMVFEPSVGFRICTRCGGMS
jgi:hypothetical protein